MGRISPRTKPDNIARRGRNQKSHELKILSQKKQKEGEGGEER